MMRRSSLILFLLLVALYPLSVARAAVIRSASFENASITDATTGCSSTSGTVSRSTSSPISGSASALVSGGTSYCAVSGTMGQDAYVSAKVKFSTLPSSDARVIYLRSSSTAYATIYVTSAGKLSLRNGSGVAIGADSATLSTGTVYTIAVHRKYNGGGATGQLEGYLNGSMFAGDSSQTLGSGSADNARFGSVDGGAYDALFDDISLEDSQPSTPTNTPTTAPPSNTPTATTVPPSNTPTATTAPPSNTPTRTNTPVPATATNTPVPGSCTTLNSAYATPGPNAQAILWDRSLYAADPNYAATSYAAVTTVGDFYGFTFELLSYTANTTLTSGQNVATVAMRTSSTGTALDYTLHFDIGQPSWVGTASSHSYTLAIYSTTSNVTSFTVRICPVLPITAPTNTPVPATATNTPVPATATNTAGPGTPTNTPVVASPTNTVGIPTDTPILIIVTATTAPTPTPDTAVQDLLQQSLAVQVASFKWSLLAGIFIVGSLALAFIRVRL